MNLPPFLTNWLRPSPSEAARQLAKRGAENRAAKAQALRRQRTDEMRARLGKPRWEWKS